MNTSEPPLATPGKRFAERYEITAELSRGALSAVFSATDLATGRQVALKLSPATDDQTMVAYHRYQAELASLAESMTDSRVVFPTAVGRYADVFYVALPWIPNARTLFEILRSRPPTLADSIKILRELSQAVAKLHAIGVMHGDVKPSNVLIIGDTDPSIRLIDFGMVRFSDVTDKMLVVGTLKYLPESLQRRQDRGSDFAYVDLYALGVVAYDVIGFGELVSRHFPPTARAVGHALTQTYPDVDVVAPPDTVNVIASVISDLMAHPGQNVDAEALSRRYDDVFHVLSRLPPIAPGTARERGSAIETGYTNSWPIAREVRQLRADFLEISRALTVDAEGRAVPASMPDPVVVALNQLFDAGRARAARTWTASFGMSVVGFTTLASVIFVSLGLAIATRTSTWILVSGGSALALVFGSLIWKPFDRVFRATILAQRLDLINATVLARYHAASDSGARVAALEDAAESLDELFARHDRSASTGRQRRKPRLNSGSRTAGDAIDTEW